MMKRILAAGAACLVLILNGGALCESPVMKTNSFAGIFNEAAKQNNLDRSATLQQCRTAIFSGCVYRISERTVVVVGGKAEDAAKSITVITRRSGEPIPALFKAEDEQIWPVIVQILNPELPPEQRKVPVDKFNAMIQAGQSSFTTKIGVNRYSAAAAPDMGIWMIANLKPVTWLPASTWIANWQQRIRGWMTKIEKR